MTEIKTKHWQRKAIEIYDTRICDMSFDHISVDVGMDENNEPQVYEINELGYDNCPKCASLAPIVNINMHQPKKLIKMCDCGHETPVNRPELVRAYLQNQ